MFFSFFYLQEPVVFLAALIVKRKVYPHLLFISSSFELHGPIVTFPNSLNQSKTG
jgi:hypothetical protein